MFFESWASLARIAIVAVCAYIGLIFLLRISGKRTLSKMNAFDFVVTVALGSILATIILSKDTPLVEGLLAFAILIFLQFIITWLSVRIKAVSNLVKAEPRLLYHRQKFLHGAMKDERVNKEEMLQAMRRAGFSDPEEVGAVILETDGSLSVVGRVQDKRAKVLSSINGV